MTDRIYFVSDDETLKPMEARPYADEDLLQRLLERYPDLPRDANGLHDYCAKVRSQQAQLREQQARS